MGETLFLIGLTSTSSPGLDRSSLATPSHCRIESSRRRYRRVSGRTDSEAPIHSRSALKSRLIWMAPESLQEKS